MVEEQAPPAKRATYEARQKGPSQAPASSAHTKGAGRDPLPAPPVSRPAGGGARGARLRSSAQLAIFIFSVAIATRLDKGCVISPAIFIIISVERALSAISVSNAVRM